MIQVEIMTKIQEFLLIQIAIDCNSIQYLLDEWKEPTTPQQRYILTILLGKCYGYLNTLKESIND